MFLREHFSTIVFVMLKKALTSSMIFTKVNNITTEEIAIYR